MNKLGKRTLLSRKIHQKDSSVNAKKKRSLLSVKRQFCLSKDTSVKKIDRTGKILHKNRKKGHYNEHLDFRNHPIQNIK